MTFQTALQTDAPPRAIGSVHLSTKALQKHSVLDTLYQRGSARAVFPRSEVGMTSVLLNTSGGVTGGDRFDYSLEAGAESHLTVTTQACERAYRSVDPLPGRIETHLRVAQGATLWWLPQETLLFDGCNLQRRLTCDLADAARALIIEPICFGRLAMGETHISGTISDRIDLRRGGAPLVRDAWKLNGDLTAHMQQAAVGNGATAMATGFLVAPEAAKYLSPIRDCFAGRGGASLLAPDVLALRLLATDGFDLRVRLLPVLDLLTASTLPICWRL